MRSKIYLDLDQNNQGELVIKSVISDDIRDKSVNNFFNKLHSCSGNNLSFLYQSLKETKDFPAHQQIKISPTAKELYFPKYDKCGQTKGSGEAGGDVLYSEIYTFETIENNTPRWHSIIKSTFETICHYKELGNMEILFFRDYVVIQEEGNEDPEEEMVIPIYELHYTQYTGLRDVIERLEVALGIEQKEEEKGEPKAVKFYNPNSSKIKTKYSE